jgi:hypothetical protein
VPRGRNDYETAQIQGRLWTPAVLRPAAWYDAADLSTISMATGVSEWRDKSGNGRHATQSTSGAQPVIDGTAFNGLNSIYANADGKNLLISVSPYASYPISIISAIKLRVFGDGAFVKLGDGGGTGIGLGRGSSDLNSPGNNIIGVKENVAWVTTSTPIASSSVLVMVQPSSGNTEIFQNGQSVVITGGASNVPSNPQMSAFLIGYSQGDRWFTDYVGEIILLTERLSSYDRARYEGYLGWKWGIPLAADHPFGNRPPLIGD